VQRFQGLLKTPARDQKQDRAGQHQQQSGQGRRDPAVTNHAGQHRLGLWAGDHRQPEADDDPTDSKYDPHSALPEAAEGDAEPQNHKDPVEEDH